MQLPPIINCVAVCLQVTPSVYTQEMLQSTEERLANTTEVHPPQILELLDMSKTTQHKVNLPDNAEIPQWPKTVQTVFDFRQSDTTVRKVTTRGTVTVEKCYSQSQQPE